MNQARATWITGLATGVFAVTVIVGCGGGAGYEGPARVAVKGTVTLDGQPVDGGSITFIPDDETKRKAGGPIVGGQYDIPEAKGPNAGRHTVQIRWLKPVGEKPEDPDKPQPTKEAIPLKYNEVSELFVEITTDKQPNEHPFDLQSN